MSGIICPRDFSAVTGVMRSFFEEKGFLEVHPQNRLSILAACEDPTTIATFEYNNKVWPLPQTGQMWLEYELLKNPDSAPGYFCVSTSYRNEPEPVEGRHDKIFPMFEFELKGGIEELMKLEKELLERLGFTKTCDDYPEGAYAAVAEEYGTEELDHQHEEQLCKDFGPVFFLTNFPNETSPFWNMQQNPDKKTAKKIDVILHGMETIGSAERSTSVKDMRAQFYSISDGEYADTLFQKFGQERVEKELNEFLKHSFFPRSGGGIGVTRMIRAMRLSNLI